MEDKSELTLSNNAAHHSLSFDKRVETSRGGTFIRKAKSLNPQFLINIDGLINNVAGSFHKMDSNINGSSRNELRYSLSFTAPNSFSQELSDVLKFPSSKCGKNSYLANLISKIINIKLPVG